MTTIKLGTKVWEIHDHEWPHWVRNGWIPPNALVFSPQWTKGIWRTADGLEVYHLYRPTPGAVVEEPADDSPRRGILGMFRGPGISVTEVLILVNVAIATGLFFLWGDAYGTQQGIWGFSKTLRAALFDGWLPVLLIPIFLHASVEHIAGNMVTLFASGAVVEEYYGRARMFGMYMFSGITGALLSLAREKDVLSVGASGAIMGMFGVALVFLIRERRHFALRDKWRMRRIYVPFFALMVLPAILHADFYAHLGGFLGGVIAALFVRPLPQRLPRPLQSDGDASPPVTPGDTASSTDTAAPLAMMALRPRPTLTQRASSPRNVPDVAP